MVLVKVCQWVHINKKFSKYEEKQHMDDNQILDKIAPLNKTRLVGGFFFFFFFPYDKIALPLDTFLSLSLFISYQILFYQYFTIYFLPLYQYQTQFLPLYQYQREEGMKKCQWRIEE